MRNLYLLLILFGMTAGSSAQMIKPDTVLTDSLQTPAKTDTVIVKGADTLSRPLVADTLVSGKKTNLRSPTGALLRSLAIPGWGQVYNKKYFKALIVAGGQGALLGTAIVEWKRASDAQDDLDLEGYRLHTNNRNMLLWLYAAATVVSILDAYVDAHLSQDTGEGVPQIGNIFLEPDAEKQALLLKIKMDF
ncbi:MAG: DUF5683 domain-containing protein [candidate division Zixibacteria bacterium]|nr:DUF5683 domain-containing protein [candidate division Zixibacteria bacterium]MCI0530336.1 DUF5683 domain-containing protein [candidate division Zixibacteria bacterium]